MTNREFFKAIANNNITDEVIAKANEELTKLDARNEKRRNTETENDKANAEIAKDIIKFLSENGATLSADIAKALNLYTPAPGQSPLVLKRISPVQEVASGVVACDVEFETNATL